MRKIVKFPHQIICSSIILYQNMIGQSINIVIYLKILMKKKMYLTDHSCSLVNRNPLWCKKIKENSFKIFPDEELLVNVI